VGSTVIGGVIVGLILFYGFGVGNPPQISNTKPPEQTSVEPPEQTATEPPEQTAYTITPKDIFANIDNVPLAQRDLVAENYKGIKVSWKVSLTIVSLRDGKMTIYARAQERYSVCAEIDPNQYPEFKVMYEGTSFNIEGEIDYINTLLEIIHLTNCEIYY
jgi:hypothetical protein